MVGLGLVSMIAVKLSDVGLVNVILRSFVVCDVVLIVWAWRM